MSWARAQGASESARPAARQLTRIFPASSIAGRPSLQPKGGRPMARKPEKRNFVVGAAFAAVLGVLAACQAILDQVGGGGPTVIAPMYEVDPLWPKPLPNHWVLGMTIGVWVDDDDHIWIIHRSSATLARNEKPLEDKTG